MALKMSATGAVLLQNDIFFLAPLTYKNEKQNAATATYGDLLTYWLVLLKQRKT